MWGGQYHRLKQMRQPNSDVNIEVTREVPPTTQQPERLVKPKEGPLELGVGNESDP